MPPPNTASWGFSPAEIEDVNAEYSVEEGDVSSLGQDYALPEGYELDTPSLEEAVPGIPAAGQDHSLPEGYVLDTPPSVGEAVAPQEVSPTEEKPSATLEQRGARLAASTGFGAVGGAASPEILAGAGRAVGLIPHPLAKAAGAGLATAGAALGAHRTRAAIMGAASAVIADITKQSMESMDQPGWASETAGFIAGMAIGPLEVAGQKIFNLGKAFLRATSPKTEAVYNAMSRSFSPAEDATVREALRKEGIKPDALEDMFKDLADGMKMEIGAKKQALGEIVAGLKSQAKEVASYSEKEASQILKKASDLKEQTVQQLSERYKSWTENAVKLKNVLRQQGTADALIVKNIASPIDDKPIGNVLRAVTEKSMKELAEKRSALYTQSKTAVDNIISRNVAQGYKIENTPSYQSLLKELSDTLNLGGEGVEKALREGGASLTEPGLRNEVTGILSALRGIPTKTEEGVEYLAPNFHALDDIRRRLGYVGHEKGAEAGGFQFISADNARRLYKKIGDIQDEYVGGELFKRMNTSYSKLTETLDKYDSSLGQAVVEKNKFFSKLDLNDIPPENLVREAFKSSNSVKEMKELLGGRGSQVLNPMADAYIAKQLQGKNSDEVVKWLGENKNWVDELPLSRRKVDSFISELIRSEKVTGKVTKVLTETYPEKLIPLAEKRAQKAMETVEKQSQEALNALGEKTKGQTKELLAMTEEAGAKATLDIKKLERLLENATPAAVVENLFTGKASVRNVEQMSKWLSKTKQTPTLVEAMKQSLATKSGDSLLVHWNMRLKPALRGSDLFTPTQIAEVDKLFKSREHMALGKKMILSGLGGSLAATAGQLTTGR